MPADQKDTQTSQSHGGFLQDISEIERASKRHPHCTDKPWHMRSAPRTLRSVLAFVIAASALLAANRATAQTGGTGGTISGTGGVTSGLAATDFTILFVGYTNGQWVQMNTTTQQYYFNQARCLCDTDPNGEFEVIVQPGSGAGSKIQTALENSSTGGGQGYSYLFASAAGYDCLNPTSYANYGLAQFCTNLVAPHSGYPGTTFTSMATFGNLSYVTSKPIPVAYLFNALSTPYTCGYNNGNCDATTLCSTTSTQLNLQFWVQTNSGIAPDFDPGPSAAVNLVGNVPVTPANVFAEGGNEALNVTWDWGGVNIATDSSLLGVQIFCQRGADTQVFATGAFGGPSYQTPSILCPKNLAAAAAATSAGGPFAGMDQKYMCSGLIPAASTSHRITGLQNGIEYGVGVAAVDKYGNIGAIGNVVYGTPIPTVDFYDEYKKLGGSAQGGFCAVASRPSRQSAALGISLAGLALMLVVRRRSRKSPPGMGPFVLVLATGTLLAGQARAQPVYHDSAFEEDRVSEAWGGSPREYAIEARFGLYTPNVDSAFSGTTPHADVFGSKRRPMWQMEFDWEFLQEFGTLSLGGVIGYYKENALACKQTGWQPDGTCPSPDPKTPDPLAGRSGDNTALRLIPLAVLLVYRMDEAANHWHIPLVPYAKIGLNYTIWTITNGNGDVAYASGGKGQGGTMGWQAAVGLSLSLDFLDPGAARGFDADSGVNHTYAFFELDHIDGAGLYRKDVLRVGDDTWFTGLMFEF
jgi:hypothetical protein